MSFLVDTNVLSESLKRSPNQTALAWIEDNEASLWTSTVVIGEIRFGIECLPAGERKVQLSSWLGELSQIMEGRILSYNQSVAHVWGQMQAELQRKGQAMPALDGIIAATARRHALTVVTRNVADFERAGLKVLNPFD